MRLFEKSLEGQIVLQICALLCFLLGVSFRLLRSPHRSNLLSYWRL